MNTNIITECTFTNSLLTEFASISVKHSKVNCAVSIRPIKETLVEDLQLRVVFNQPIRAWRNHDYKWVDTSKARIANDYAPKILVLDDGTHIISSKNIGLWEFNPNRNNEIIWILKHPDLTPTFQYRKHNTRVFNTQFKLNDYDLNFLITKSAVPEFSRSKIPFSAIICFTDHCDLDTEENLKTQLHFFNKHGVTITKSFFLNNYSKRDNNSSYQENKELINLFQKSNHEIAYHSLSQSVKETTTSFLDFKEFKPIPNVYTWIDHGFQPYNFTFYTENGMDTKTWSDNIASKHIENLWSYVDSGTAGKGIINQLNPSHFTAKKILQHHFFLSPRLFKRLFRTLLFYSDNDNLVSEYRAFTNLVKKLIYKKRFSLFFPALKKGFKLGYHVLKILGSRDARNSPFKYAKYAPLIFEQHINDHSFFVFQTVEVTDFESTFSKSNLDLLCKERGVIICHNYFSSNIKYQKGKLFDNNEDVTKLNDQNFSNLGSLIKNKVIWNPTINDLINQYRKCIDIEYYIDANTNNIKVKNQSPDVAIRYIKHES